MEPDCTMDAAGSAVSMPWTTPPTVNYHLWAACNMRCRFCFAPFQDVIDDVLPRGHLPREEALQLVRMLAARFSKVTFVGGEPTLCPWLPELIRTAKDLGAITMLVTNGSNFRRVADKLDGVLDWVTLSIDSASDQTLVELGRAIQGKRAIPTWEYIELAQHIRSASMRLKVNTVVTARNAGEDMSALLLALRPERWKVLQVLPVDGQNTGKVEPLLCSSAEFDGFVRRHQHLENEGIAVVPEDNEDMRGSYAMVDPAGRFFDNVRGGYRYTQPILKVGLRKAWSEVAFSMERFRSRGGEYDFGSGAAAAAA